MTLPDIRVADDCDYVAAFLTMQCNYKCEYCLNEFEAPRPEWKLMSGADWTRGLARLTNLDRTEGVIPVSLQGGEPSMHPDFYEIINNTPDRIRLDLLTNLDFDVGEMIDKVDPERFARDAPHPTIRVSYHPEQCDIYRFLANVRRLADAGFSIGIWAVLHPKYYCLINRCESAASSMGLYFRTRPFLGYYQERLWGDYKYPDACTLRFQQSVKCRTTKVLIGPNGGIYRCHADLYEAARPANNILSECGYQAVVCNKCDYKSIAFDQSTLSFRQSQHCEEAGCENHILTMSFRMANDRDVCDHYGFCNPSDVVIKTDRLQRSGYTTAEIEVSEE